MFASMAAQTVSRREVTVENHTQSATALGAEHSAFLGLASIKGVGFKTLVGIADSGLRFTDVFSIEETDEAVDALKRFGARIDGAAGSDWRRVREQASERASRLAESLASDGTAIVFRNDTSFPTSLLDLPSPPHWLFVRGSLDVLSVPSIAVVGTREPSEDGRWLAKFVGACLTEWKAPTVSGLALGIDQLIHEASLRAKLPTIAILGTGILSDYPRGASELRERIIDGGGAIVTEYLPRESYSAENFVKRNRIQAALGRVLIPAEWNAKSGTAHTVKFAASLSRPISCLRMPDWAPERVALPKDRGAEVGHLFTVPGEESDFRSYVRRGLDFRPTRNTSSAEKPQLSLFSGS